MRGGEPPLVAEFTPERIAKFWTENPCGSQFVREGTWKDFFLEYDRFKYKTEPHILRQLDKIDFEGKRILEIGMGQGAEAQQIMERGASYNGIDITGESVRRVQLRSLIFGLQYQSVSVSNAECLAFRDETFDLVFSHGVIHHSPRIRNIVGEIHRVLKPGGTVVLMLYHRNSINYQISIKILRRIGIFFLFLPGVDRFISRITGEPLHRLNLHKENLRRSGLGYLKMNNFIHKATDGPDNVYSSVYSEKEARDILAPFRELSFSRHMLNERHLPVIRNMLSDRMKKGLESRFGWHLWCVGVK